MSKTNDRTLQYTIFAALYLASGNQQEFESVENNFAGIKMNEYWGEVSQYFNGEKYYCSSSNQPFATFNSVSENVDFLIARWFKRVSAIKNINSIEITKFWIINEDATTKDSNIYTTFNTINLITIENEVQKSIDIAKPFFK